LSFWGWGYADRFPDQQSRGALAEQVAALLGFQPLELAEPPAVADIHVPDTRLDIPPEFKAFATDNAINRAAHTYGKSYRDIIRGLSGNFDKAPDLIVFPRDENDVIAVLDWCSREEIAVVPFGGGTSVVGGIECSGRTQDGVVCMDMRGMNKVLAIDEVSQLAHIQAGATGPQIEDELQKSGLTLRHYPQSFEFSTLGGWIATRAGGHFATRYTHIDDLVNSVSMVTPQGEYKTARVPASGAGPDPKALVLGSEGTLGVITDAWMRVRKKPTFRATATVGFENFDDGVAACRDVAQARLYPSNCRLLDKREAMLNQLPSDGKHVLLLGFESAYRAQNGLMNDAMLIAERHGGVAIEGPFFRSEGERAPGSTMANSWKRSFFDAPYLHTSLVSMGVIVDTFETACTWDRFQETHQDIIRSVRAAMQRATGRKGIVTCRFTHVYPDGPAPYYTFLAQATPGQETDQWAEIRWAAADALSRNGATITHHHGVGRLHRPWYEKEVPLTFRNALIATKQSLDPVGILNPGALVDPVS